MTTTKYILFSSILLPVVLVAVFIFVPSAVNAQYYDGYVYSYDFNYNYSYGNNYSYAVGYTNYGNGNNNYNNSYNNNYNGGYNCCNNYRPFEYQITYNHVEPTIYYSHSNNNYPTYDHQTYNYPTNNYQNYESSGHQGRPGRGGTYR
ncbi:MAG: hypothetical protein WCG02_01505 [Candidatus Taylorbacteria bacterium]